MTAYKLGTVMSHMGQPHPEAEPWIVLKILNIDVKLAKKAVHKLYFEEVHYVPELYENYHDVFFIPNDTQYGSLFAIKYGTKRNE